MIKYDVQKSVDYILDDENPTSLRAIWLFTLLVALHAGRSRAAVTGRKASQNGSSLFISVPRKVLREARLLAAMKFLDQIESEWRANNPGQPVRLAELAANDAYRQIFEKVVLKHGGWNKIRYSRGIRNLEDDISAWKRNARDVARIIEFSAKFQPNLAKPKQVGGITMAIDIVTSEPGRRYFHTKRKHAQLETFWKQLKSAAPFHYLLYVQKHPFVLQFIAGKNFPTRWRTHIEDSEKLLDFFIAYNQVVEHLAPRGYHYSLLNLPIPALLVKGDGKYGLSRNALTASFFEVIKPTERHAKPVLQEIANYRRG